MLTSNKFIKNIHIKTSGVRGLSEMKKEFMLSNGERITLLSNQGKCEREGVRE